MTAIVIPYYRGQEFIWPCIRSIIATTKEDFHIYVVDNDPSSLDLEHKCVTAIKCRSNIGFGRAVNAGAYTAIDSGAKKVIVSNQDVIFEQGAIATLTDLLDPKKDIISLPFIKTYDLKSIEPHFITRVLSNTQYERDSRDSSIKTTYEVDIAGAACFGIHRNTILKYGLFDPVFHMYGEDDDLFDRVRKHGGKLLIAPAASIGHNHSLTSASGAQREVIRRQQLLSQDILHIRRSKSQQHYLKHKLKDIARSVLKGRFDQIPTHFNNYKLNIKRWEQLVDSTPGAVKQRIDEALMHDVSDG